MALVSSLYNPYAAAPSMHIGYAPVVAVTLLRHFRAGVRSSPLGALCPPFVLLVIVATGNHFFLDAAAGAITVAVAAASASVITRKPRLHAARPALRGAADCSHVGKARGVRAVPGTGTCPCDRRRPA